jgi:hypothetical protein
MEWSIQLVLWWRLYCSCLLLEFIASCFKVLLALSVLDVIVTAYCVYYVMRKHNKQLEEKDNNNSLYEDDDLSFGKVIKFFYNFQAYQ